MSTTTIPVPDIKSPGIRKNLRLDAMLGSLRKHWMRTRRPSSGQPKWSTSSVTIRSSVMPWSGFLGWGLPAGSVMVSAAGAGGGRAAGR